MFGQDQILVNTLKCIKDFTLDIPSDLFNKAYKTGNMLNRIEWLLSTFCAIPKTPHDRDYHTFKVFLRVIYAGINKKLEGIYHRQFVSRNWRGTTEKLFALNVLEEWCVDKNIDKHVCYFKFDKLKLKGFNKVTHENLVKILQTSNIDNRVSIITPNVYWNQCTQIIVEPRTKPRNRNESIIQSVFE